MAVSKHRKTATRRRPKRKPNRPDVSFVENQKVRIRKRRFDQLRENADFIALVRVGRVFNALNYAVEVTTSRPDIKTAKGRRTAARSFQIAAGFTHEAIEVFYALRQDFEGQEFFAKARALLYPENKRREKILKLIRDSSAFHLDSEGKVTAKVLREIKDLNVIDIYSSDGTTYGDFCFDMADTVDLNYWIATFRGEEKERDTFREIVETTGKMTSEAMIAAYEIMRGLVERLELTPND